MKNLALDPKFWDFLGPEGRNQKENVFCHGEFVAKDIFDQLVALKRHFPDFPSNLLPVDDRTVNSFLPLEAEGLVIRPDWRLFADSYAGAVQVVFQALKNSRPTILINKDSFVSGKLFNSKRTSLAMEALACQQEKSILVFPVRINFPREENLRRVSSRIIRNFLMNDRKKFPLDIFTIGIILLTHPEITQPIDCWGDDIFEDGGETHRTPSILSGYEDDGNGNFLLIGARDDTRSSLCKFKKPVGFC